MTEGYFSNTTSRVFIMYKDILGCKVCQDSVERLCRPTKIPSSFKHVKTSCPWNKLPTKPHPGFSWKETGQWTSKENLQAKCPTCTVDDQQLWSQGPLRTYMTKSTDHKYSGTYDFTLQVVNVKLSPWEESESSFKVWVKNLQSVRILLFSFPEPF